MSWQSWRIPGVVWSIEGIRHAIDQLSYGDDTFAWGSACGVYETDLTTVGGKKPRTFKGFVTCFQCLAKGDAS